MDELRHAGHLAADVTADHLARIGDRAFSIRAGTTTAVRVKLSRPAFAAIASARRLTARAHVRYAQVDGTTSEQSRAITLRAP